MSVKLSTQLQNAYYCTLSIMFGIAGRTFGIKLECLIPLGALDIMILVIEKTRKDLRFLNNT